MPSSDPDGRHTCEHIADVFAVGNEREEPIGLTPQTRSLSLGQPSPDAVALAVGERVLEAVQTHLAVDANTLRRIAGTPAFGEEQIGIFTSTRRALLPVITDTPHDLDPLIGGRTQARNYTRVIVEGLSRLSRGDFR